MADALDAVLATLDGPLDALRDAARLAVRKALAHAFDDPTGAGGRQVGPMLLTFDEAASVIGISRSTLYNLVRDGQIPTVQVPGVGRPRIRRADSEAFVEGLPLRDGKAGRLRSAG